MPKKFDKMLGDALKALNGEGMTVARLMEVLSDHDPNAEAFVVVGDAKRPVIDVGVVGAFVEIIVLEDDDFADLDKGDPA
jgi:hypothetical protein